MQAGRQTDFCGQTVEMARVQTVSQGMCVILRAWLEYNIPAAGMLSHS